MGSNICGTCGRLYSRTTQGPPCPYCGSTKVKGDRESGDHHRPLTRQRVLTEREAEIVRMRWVEKQTVQALALHYHVSRQRMMQTLSRLMSEIAYRAFIDYEISQGREVVDTRTLTNLTLKP